MAAPVKKDQELELKIDSLAYGGNGVARLNGFVVFVRRGLPGRHGARPGDEREAESRGGAGARGRRARPRAGGGAVHALPRLRRLPLPGSRLRGADRGEGGAGAGGPAPDRRPSRSRRSSRSSRPSRSSTTATSSSTRSRRRRPGRRSASTRPAAGTRCSTSSAAGSRLISETPSGWRCATGRARSSCPPTTRPSTPGICGTSSSAKAATPGRRSSSSSPRPASLKSARESFVETLRRFPEVRSIHWSVNERPAEVTNLPTKLLWGEDAIEEELNGLRFRVRPNAFLQTNTAMAERLYGIAVECAGADRRGDGVRPVLRDRDDRPDHGARGADGVGRGSLGGVGRLRPRERPAQRDREHGVLRGRGGGFAGGARGPGRERRTWSSSIRRVPACRGRRCGGWRGWRRRASSTSRATRRRWPATSRRCGTIGDTGSSACGRWTCSRTRRTSSRSRCFFTIPPESCDEVDRSPG